MRKPELRELQAMSALQGNSDFVIFMGWLDSRFRELVEGTIMDVMSTDAKHRAIQGMAMNCKEIIDAVRTADEKIRMIQSGAK
jgi:hypothetical protein